MTLTEALNQATVECAHPIEEEGGLVLYDKANDNYEFIKLRNDNTGKPNAPVLWTADRYEYADKVLPKIQSRNWQHYASFHTHPRFSALPSGIDLTVLFPGFPINFIYAPLHKEITSWFYEFETNKVTMLDTYTRDTAGNVVIFELPNAVNSIIKHIQIN